MHKGHHTTLTAVSLRNWKAMLHLKPGELYQAAVYAWNAFREDKSITTVKYDTKKGLY